MKLIGKAENFQQPLETGVIITENIQFLNFSFWGKEIMEVIRNLKGLISSKTPTLRPSSAVEKEFQQKHAYFLW